MVGFRGMGKMGLMKTKKKQHSLSAADPKPVQSNDPMSALEDPFYGHSDWVDPAMKQAVSQEARRMSQHSGKSIRRPQGVARTMGS